MPIAAYCDSVFFSFTNVRRSVMVCRCQCVFSKFFCKPKFFIFIHLKMYIICRGEEVYLIPWETFAPPPPWYHGLLGFYRFDVARNVVDVMASKTIDPSSATHLIKISVLAVVAASKTKTTAILQMRTNALTEWWFSIHPHGLLYYYFVDKAFSLSSINLHILFRIDLIWFDLCY